MLETIGHDLRGALRHAMARPVLAFAVTGTLAAAIAAATTALGLAFAVLWRPLPFADAARLTFVWETVGAESELHPSRVSGARYAAWQERSTGAFSSLALFGAAGFTMETPGGAVSIRGVRVSTGYFDTLGIGPALGRTFQPEDVTSGREDLVVLSHGFWLERFGARPDVIGETIRLGGRPFTVIGVMPPAAFPGWPVNPATVTIDPGESMFWVPMSGASPMLVNDRAHVFGVVGRLADGISVAQAADRLRAATDGNAADPHGASVTPLRQQFVRDARTPLMALTAAALALLMMACANVASLYVTAFETRRTEFAVRAALGASVVRLIRQIAVEALLLAAAGAVAGLAIARVALRALPAALPTVVPFLTTPAVDGPVAASGIALALIAALLMTAWPVRRLATAAPAPRGLPERARGVVYRGLVVSQVAIAVALATVAALLGQSLHTVGGQDPGFAIERVLVADLGLPSASPVDPRRIAAAETAVLAAVARVPGVTAVAAAYDHPLEANWSERPTLLGDAAVPESRPEAELRIVSPGYLEALGVDLLDGRAFTVDDDLDRPGVALVNEAFARSVAGSVIGRRLRTGTPRATYGPAAATEFVVVGVVRNERFRGLEAPISPAFYLSTRQFPQAGVSILARTAGDPAAATAAVRNAVHGVDRSITFDDPIPLDEILAAQLVTRRMTTRVIGGFGAAALALAGLGLYGLLAVLVASRTREIGVRLAIGESPARVAHGVLRESLWNVGAGAGIGVLLALLGGRLVQSLLVGVSATDPRTLAAVVGTLLVIAGLAALPPALRAARIDPLTALRSE